MANEKCAVRLDGVAIAANSAFGWSLRPGTSPVQAMFEVHEKSWDSHFVQQERFGKPLTLEIVDDRGVSVTFKQVYLLHGAPSDGPRRRAGLISDLRWKWPYKLVCRDYNVPKKTGDVRIPNGQDQLPAAQAVTVDQYAYRPYSIRPDGTRWTAKQIVEDVMDILMPRDDPSDPARWFIESWPIAEGADGASSGDGQFAVQNLILRDQGDAALARVLSYVPGAEVAVDPDGRVRIYDAADTKATKDYFAGLPMPTWDGDHGKYVQRFAVRPGRVIVHYQREVELRLTFSDSWDDTTAAPLNHLEPFVENVIPLVDPITEVATFDELQRPITVGRFPAGTLLPARTWLEYMETLRQQSMLALATLPWTFSTLKVFWPQNDLDGAFGATGVAGAGGADDDPLHNLSLRVQALKHNFRQLFRLNRRYAENCRHLIATRVGVLDPVTGARMPAMWWGQAAFIPSAKGFYISGSRTDGAAGYWARNVDYLTANSDDVSGLPPGPCTVSVVDEDIGLFRFDLTSPPYGSIERWIPGLLFGGNGDVRSPTSDLSRQDTEDLGFGLKRVGATAGMTLSPRNRQIAMVTAVPSAPNNEKQFHRQAVTATQVKELFRSEFAIEGGSGPDLHVFIPPGELTARFSWASDAQAASTLPRLFGLDAANPNEGGIDSLESGAQLPGFSFINLETEIKPHAAAVAAEMLSLFADAQEGRIATRMPDDGPQLVGGMSDATVRVAGFPSGKVNVLHGFPGRQRLISRLSMLPESARHLILGTLPFGK